MVRSNKVWRDWLDGLACWGALAQGAVVPGFSSITATGSFGWGAVIVFGKTFALILERIHSLRPEPV